MALPFSTGCRELMALTSELAAARQRKPSAEQREAVLPHCVELSDAVALFRARWRRILRPET
jgi:hypothetical protein